MQRDPQLHIKLTIWRILLSELHRRTRECHESGAFLLGRVNNGDRIVEEIVYYDDLDPHAYRTGVVVMHASSFGVLWDHCKSRKLSVVADIHVHPKGAWQSLADRNNPMIALRGHLALILPYFARPPVRMQDVGFFEYLGSHRWRDLSGDRISRYLHIRS